MPINVTVSRPKLNTTNNISISLSPDTPTQSGSKIFLKVFLNDLAPDPATFSCTFVDTQNTLTFTNNTGKVISDVIRVGDVISGANSPYSGTAYITDISVVGTAVTVTVSEAATVSGTESLTFTAGQIDSTLYILELDHVASGSNLQVRPALYTFDGTKVLDANRDGDDDALVTDAVGKANLALQSINVDSFLLNARLQRTNV